MKTPERSITELEGHLYDVKRRAEQYAELYAAEQKRADLLAGNLAILQVAYERLAGPDKSEADLRKALSNTCTPAERLVLDEIEDANSHDGEYYVVRPEDLYGERVASAVNNWLAQLAEDKKDLPL
jgi:hypothetical protein